MPSIGVVLVAAGLGQRLGAGAPKAFARVQGRTLLEHALGGVQRMTGSPQVVIVVPHSHLDVARTLAPWATVVPGGLTRQDSVAAGLAVLHPGVQTVLVHDAARALCPPALFDRVVDAVAGSGTGVIPVLPVVDTIKRVAGDVVVATVDRSALVQVQTPQGFPRDAIVAAYARAEQEHTDDAAVFQAAGGQVRAVPGDPAAFKVTVPADLDRVRELLTGDRQVVRTGIGTDVHRFDETVPLWLGALHWPEEPGLAGHSDGDAISHAICDALLSAAGLGDIGSRFGTEDPRLEGAHGDLFITETVALLASAGFRVGHVAVQLIAERPRIGPRRAELEARLAELIGAPVSVGATTSDGLGFTGAGEGVIALASALVRRAP